MQTPIHYKVFTGYTSDALIINLLFIYFILLWRSIEGNLTLFPKLKFTTVLVFRIINMHISPNDSAIPF